MKEFAKGNDNIKSGAQTSVVDTAFGHKKWTITKYNSNEDYQNDNPFEVSEFEGNVLLNEGITVLQKLLTNSGSQPTPFSDTGASLGVGADNTAEAASQTGLQASAASHSYATMSSGYPSISGQTTTWRAVFPSGSGNFDWREFTVANSASNAGDNLNRKVSNQGTKAPGQTWTLDLQITWS